MIDTNNNSRISLLTDVWSLLNNRVYQKEVVRLEIPSFRSITEILAGTMPTGALFHTNDDGKIRMCEGGTVHAMKCSVIFSIPTDLQNGAMGDIPNDLNIPTFYRFDTERQILMLTLDNSSKHDKDEGTILSILQDVTNHTKAPLRVVVRYLNNNVTTRHIIDKDASCCIPCGPINGEYPTVYMEQSIVVDERLSDLVENDDASGFPRMSIRRE